MRVLVLWDVDGTLVDVGGVGAEAFDAAFEAVLGRVPDAPLAGMVSMAGRTDHEITLEVLALHGVADGERHLPAFATALVRALADRIDQVRANGRALPGAARALAALHRRPEVLQSLLTGNVEANALAKLAAFGLERYLDLEVGGYGSDHRRRPELVAVARRRAEAKHGVAFGPDQTVLIGDTPLDVAAGVQGGARVVAVATGRFGAGELAAAGADAVLEDLCDTAGVLAAVLGG
ncbi:MAG TPA: haloacid dehalogenase-like hydrolase [Actinomycetes bacterium]|nr:haloacid dehalogenase-like hydrolase [Actinomycetes bacterium]